PLTLNALVNACNQTSNRAPVVDYDERTVEAALASLREQDLTRIVHSVHNRATKYRHVLDEVWRLDQQQVAVLGLLMLRGPQTAAELRSRSERLTEFESGADVEAALRNLAERDEALVVQLPRAPGQKEPRWVHLLSGEPDVEVFEAASAPARSSSSGLAA